MQDTRTYYDPSMVYPVIGMSRTIARLTEISAGAKLLYAWLAWDKSRRHHGENAPPSVEMMAEETGATVGQTQTYLAELHSVGAM